MTENRPTPFYEKEKEDVIIEEITLDESWIRTFGRGYAQGGRCKC